LGATLVLRWDHVDCPLPDNSREVRRGLARTTRRTIPIAFRFRGEKYRVNLKTTVRKEAEGFLDRAGGESPPRRARPARRSRRCRPGALPRLRRGARTAGRDRSKRPALRAVRNLPNAVHRRGEGGDHPGDGRHPHEAPRPDHRRGDAAFRGHGRHDSAVRGRTEQRRAQRLPGEAEDGPKSRTLRFVWNWGNRQGHIPTKFPEVGLVFPKERQPEPFRIYDQIQAILARGGIDKRKERELWDGLFLNPAEIAEVLVHVKRKTSARYLYSLLVTAAHTGARQSELFRARVEDIDFDAKLGLLREKKRSRDRETFRTVDMTPFVESVMRNYFAEVHPGGTYAFYSRANVMLTDGQTWKAFLMGVKRSKWHVLRGYHAFRHSFASNLAAAGVDQRVIDERMGHTTVEMQKRYRLRHCRRWNRRSTIRPARAEGRSDFDIPRPARRTA
jgi:integrase